MLLLFRRFIADMVGVWIGDDERWEELKKDTNNHNKDLPTGTQPISVHPTDI